MSARAAVSPSARRRLFRRPGVTAVVPNFNGRRWLKGCLESLLAQKYPGLEILLVDDASTDNSAGWVRAHYPQVRVLALRKNLGFAGACNAGVARARGELIALVNTDTLLPKGLFAGLARLLASRPEVAVVSPRIDNQNMDMARYPHTGTLSITGATIQNVIEDPKVVFGAPGALLMFRRAWGEPFDADYRFFHEDVYLSWRAWISGYAVAVAPEFTVRHLGSASVGNQPGRNAWLTERNRWLNALIFWSLGTWVRLLPIFILAGVLELGADWAAGRTGWHRAKAWAWIAGHARQVARKRRAMQAQRRAGDEVVLGLMSCRLSNARSVWGRALNYFSCQWCRLVGIRTWEMRKPRA
jgi:hypothetical protein